MLMAMLAMLILIQRDVFINRDYSSSEHQCCDKIVGDCFLFESGQNFESPKNLQPSELVRLSENLCHIKTSLGGFAAWIIDGSCVLSLSMKGILIKDHI